AFLAALALQTTLALRTDRTTLAAFAGAGEQLPAGPGTVTRIILTRDERAPIERNDVELLVPLALVVSATHLRRDDRIVTGDRKKYADRTAGHLRRIA